MKYNVYIKDEYLVFEDKHKNTTSIPVNEISEFTLTKVYGQITVPVKIGKAFFLHTHKLPNERGSIVIGFKQGDQKTIQKSNYRKVISNYPYHKIKNVEDVFRVAEVLIDLNIPYDAVMYKEIAKFTPNNKKFYSKRYLIGFEGKSSIMEYKTPED